MIATYTTILACLLLALPNCKAAEVPLNTIWAWRMPGTRPMEAGRRDGKYISEEGPLLEDIRKYLRKLPKGEDGAEKPDVGFVVNGQDLVALKEVHSILIKNRKRQRTFDEGQSLSLAFFSYNSTWYVHIHDVAVQGKSINVHFQFVPHKSRNITKHLALIPLNDLSSGDYEVTYRRIPMDEKYVAAGFPQLPATADKIVCESFKFRIGKKPER